MRSLAYNRRFFPPKIFYVSYLTTYTFQKSQYKCGQHSQSKADGQTANSLSWRNGVSKGGQRIHGSINHRFPGIRKWRGHTPVHPWMKNQIVSMKENLYTSLTMRRGLFFLTYIIQLISKFTLQLFNSNYEGPFFKTSQKHRTIQSNTVYMLCYYHLHKLFWYFAS